MPATVAGIHLKGDHASRPAAGASGLPVGAIYECTDHDKVYQTDGSAWSDYLDHSGSAAVTTHESTYDHSDLHDEDHAARHASGGADAVRLDDLAAPDDNTDLDSSTSAHGLAPKLSGTATEYLDGSGAFSTPAGASALDDLSDVAAGGGSTGDVLTQQGDGSFALETPAAGVSALADLDDVELAATASGEHLEYDASVSVGDAIDNSEVDSATSNSGTPTNALTDDTAYGSLTHGSGWIVYDYGEAIQLAKVYFRTKYLSTYYIDYSDNDVDWTNLQTGSVSSASSMVAHSYDLTDMGQSHRYWRLRCGSNYASQTARVEYLYYFAADDESVWRNVDAPAIANLTDVDVVTAAPTDGQVLVYDDGDGEWVPGDVGSTSTGTSFPGSPTTGDRYRRSDLDYMEFFYDGTRWLSAQLFTANIQTDPSTADTADTTISRVPLHPDFDTYLVRIGTASYVYATNDGSHYWTITTKKVTPANASTVVGTALDTSGHTQANWVADSDEVGEVITEDTYSLLKTEIAKTGSPGGIVVGMVYEYRLIAT